MKAVSILALMLATATPVVAQNAPAGAAATGCDTESFTAVRSERTGEILYWTNPTCQTGKSDRAMMMGGGMAGGMDGGMSGGMDGGMSGGMGGM